MIYWSSIGKKKLNKRQGHLKKENNFAYTDDLRSLKMVSQGQGRIPVSVTFT